MFKLLFAHFSHACRLRRGGGRVYTGRNGRKKGRESDEPIQTGHGPPGRAAGCSGSGGRGAGAFLGAQRQPDGDERPGQTHKPPGARRGERCAESAAVQRRGTADHPGGAGRAVDAGGRDTLCGAPPVAGGGPAAGDPGSCRGVDLGGGLPALGGGVLRRQLCRNRGHPGGAGFGGTAGGHRRVVCPAGKRHRLRGAPGRKRGLFDDGGGDFWPQ